MMFSIKDFFRGSDQIRRKLRILSHLLTKSLMENLIVCAVLPKGEKKNLTIVEDSLPNGINEKGLSYEVLNEPVPASKRGLDELDYVIKSKPEHIIIHVPSRQLHVQC